MRGSYCPMESPRNDRHVPLIVIPVIVKTVAYVWISDTILSVGTRQDGIYSEED